MAGAPPAEGGGPCDGGVTRHAAAAAPEVLPLLFGTVGIATGTVAPTGAKTAPAEICDPGELAGGAPGGTDLMGLKTACAAETC